jgi:signal peptidase I
MIPLPSEGGELGAPNRAATTDAPTTDTSTAAPRTVRQRRRPIQVAGEWLVVIVLAVGGALLIRAFIVQTFSVPSSSMYPTLQIGDRILVNKIPGLARSIHRGDIIVFHKVPADKDGQGPEDLVKRVIGMPGETISSVGDTVLINGKPLREPWLPNLDAVSPQGACAQPAYDIPKTKIPPGHYYVLGDCRGISDDSRFWGTVPSSAIIGRVFTVIWRSNHPWIHWF